MTEDKQNLSNNINLPPEKDPSTKRIKAWIGSIILILIALLASLYIWINLENYKIDLSIISSSAQIEKNGEVELINKAIKEKGAKWVAGETSLTYLSVEEKKKRVGAIKQEIKEKVGTPAPGSQPPEPPAKEAVSATLDWRDNNGNFVTPIKNQGGCASCWAFGTTAALESAKLIAANRVGFDLDTSEQVLVSCSKAGNCSSGGYINTASDYIDSWGLPVESCFPYTATNNTCSNACSSYKTDTYQTLGWKWIATTNPNINALKNALATYGPLVTMMEVYSDFYSYKSGIYSYVTGSFYGWHVILIIGYNDQEQYFICKNSWGTYWGENGFFKIAYSELNSPVSFGAYTIAYWADPSFLEPPPPETPSITVTSPNGGENLETGTTTNISWIYSADPGTTVKIELYENSAFNSLINDSVPMGSNGKGSYSWAIPTNQANGSNYKIKITSNENSSYSDFSDGNFTISTPPPPAEAKITVVAPNGGEKWRIGRAQKIKWNYSGDPGSNVQIDLYKNNVFYETIISSVAISKLSYNWRIPRAFPASSDYRIRITSLINPDILDESDNYFSLR